MRTKVVVIGSYGIESLGDDALLSVLLRMLRQRFAGEDISLYCRNAPYLRTVAPGIRVIEPDPNLLLQGELLVYGGGTQFFSHKLTCSTLLKRLQRAVSSPSDAVHYALRKLLSLRWRFGKTALLGLGIGPFVPGSRKEGQTRTVFENTEFVAVRDTDSFELCRRWGIDRATLRSDLCFLESYQSAGPAPSPAQKSLAVIIRGWPHTLEGSAYLEPLMETVGRCLAEGCSVSFFSFCRQEDLALIGCIEAAGHPVVVWNPEEGEVGEFVRRLSAFQVVITGRYHGAIFSALLGRPSICIEIEPKLRLASETLDLRPYLWRQPFQACELYARIDRLLTDDREAVLAVEAAVARQRQLARSMEREFQDYLRAER